MVSPTQMRVNDRTERALFPPSLFNPEDIQTAADEPAGEGVLLTEVLSSDPKSTGALTNFRKNRRYLRPTVGRLAGLSQRGQVPLPQLQPPLSRRIRREKLASRLPKCVLLTLVATSIILPHPDSCVAQTEFQQLMREATGQGLTPTQILQRIRESGISRANARARLMEAGYNPALLDPYYDWLEQGEDIPSVPDQSFVRALEALGLLDEGVMPTGLDPISLQSSEDPLTLEEVPDESELQVFGLNLFRHATDQFEPLTAGPVDPDYRLGPRDELILIITGDVELAYTLEVTREGFVVIPDVGQVSVNGLTLEMLRDRLFDRLSEVYSGVRRAADATTRFDISLGRLRSNQVFVIGDVTRPGAYQVSSVATVMNALYAAGGPTEVGSFRSVVVHRSGLVAGRVDLYDYLLHGESGQDVRLEQGDVVFVPPLGSQVTLRGKVWRPAIYELKEEESLSDAIRFAGGLRPEAHVERVEIDRILPPPLRVPGQDRVLLDVNLAALDSAGSPPVSLNGGDIVTVHGVLDRMVGRVTIAGDVWRPGEYGFSPGMTVWELVRQADGLTPSAFRPVAHVRRRILETGATRLLRFSLDTDEAGQPLRDFPLEDLDQVRIFSVEVLRTTDSVRVFGEVREPGTFPLDEGATVEDLLLSAGGFTAAALPYETEVVRLREGLTRTDTLSDLFRIRVEDGIPHPLGETVYAVPPPDAEYDGVAHEFILQNRDRVFVRRLPGFVGKASVQVEGEVAFPGAYAFEDRRERLSSFIARAGGFTEDAYLEGARLVRDSIPVGIDLQEALRRPGGGRDVSLEPGDRLLVPTFDPTVLITGAVAFESRAVYTEGRGLGDFLDEAGGALREADLDRISVQYLNGSRAVTWKFLFFRRFPEVKPGSRIYVPRKPEESERDWDQFLTRTLSVTSTLLTILVALDRL